MRKFRTTKTLKLFVGVLLFLSICCFLFSYIVFAKLLDIPAAFNDLLELIQQRLNQDSLPLHKFDFYVYLCVAVIQFVYIFTFLVLQKAQARCFFDKSTEYAFFYGCCLVFFINLREFVLITFYNFRKIVFHISGISENLFHRGYLGEISYFIDTTLNPCTSGSLTDVVENFSALIVFLFFDVFIFNLVDITTGLYSVISAFTFLMDFGTFQHRREGIIVWRFIASTCIKVLASIVLMNLIICCMIISQKVYGDSLILIMVFLFIYVCLIIILNSITYLKFGLGASVCSVIKEMVYSAKTVIAKAAADAAAAAARAKTN
ncbi:hypothetical protein [Bartonella sp. WD16.2]|uniref:hypothetical protein n=1 Tax=Bartonella sp. WD16.2 TaxID=1933904 RepID=UPI00099AAF49|nr:hypothetical protein [Bartonella sp. WD16.2]AQX20327.1 hypothetical protein BWD162_012290 [Bartonella sp. WD16.2]